MTTKSTDTKPQTKPKSDLKAVDKVIACLADESTPSTARYFAYSNVNGQVTGQTATVCFNSINGFCGRNKGLGIIFQGYGGFEKGDRWRAASEADLYTNIAMPFVMVDHGHYNKESLEWLKALLDPEGPFKSLLPIMLEKDPEAVQARRAFIFPDSCLIPARLTWCFAIASRLGFANPRVLWRYLHMRDRGLDSRTSLLIAGGFEHQVVAGKLSGKIIKSYTSGFLGVDVTAYAGRFLTSNPVVDTTIGEGSNPNTYNSSKVFESGKMDLKKMTFDSWEEVIEYTQARGREQSQELKIAA
jgi:hypothetical protein